MRSRPSQRSNAAERCCLDLPIEIVTPELRNLHISGVFSTDDSEAFIAFLRSLKGVRVEVTATRIRVSRNASVASPDYT
jgi:hypothetical protein